MSEIGKNEASAEVKFEGIKEELYTVTLSGDGISIDRKVSKHEALAIVQVVLGGATAAPTPNLASRVSNHENHTTSNPGKGQVSIREFVLDCEAKTNPEKIVTIAYYLDKYRDQPNFNKDDIIPGFRQAGEKAPKNWGRDLKATITSAWVAENHEEPGTYYVTNSGRMAVDNKFSKK